MFDAKSIKEKMEKIASTSDYIKAKMEVEVINSKISSIISRILKDVAGKDKKAEVIGVKIVDADYDDLCIEFTSPLSGITYMSILPDKCFEKPTTKKGDTAIGYLSMIIRSTNQYRLRYKKQNIEIKE